MFSELLALCWGVTGWFSYTTGWLVMHGVFHVATSFWGHRNAIIVVKEAKPCIIWVSSQHGASKNLSNTQPTQNKRKPRTYIMKNDNDITKGLHETMLAYKITVSHNHHNSANHFDLSFCLFWLCKRRFNMNMPSYSYKNHDHNIIITGITIPEKTVAILIRGPGHYRLITYKENEVSMMFASPSGGASLKAVYLFSA